MIAAIVEDARDIGLLLRTVLNQAGIESRMVPLDVWRDPKVWHGVSVALVDIMLGQESNGLEILKWLQEHYPDLPRIAMSAAGPLLEEAQPYANRTIRKPFAAENLIKCIHGVS